MNRLSPWSIIPVPQPRLEVLDVAAVPYFEVEDEAAVTNAEGEAHSKTQGWAAVAVNKPISTTNGEVLEVDEVDEGSAGRIMTNPNGIATPL